MIRLGNYSYLVDQEGCELDAKKLKELCQKRKIEHYEFVDNKKELSNNLGRCLHDWKIQGYWYEDFCRFLYACCECMKDLSEEDPKDWKDYKANHIEMEEEQGFKFIIRFFKEGNKPRVKVEYVPMEWHEFYINKKGEQTEMGSHLG